MQNQRRDPWPLPLLGGSAAAIRARAAFTEAAGSAAPALIVADRGLDAEAIVRALHQRSRAGLPFIEIDCASREVDVERELFGAAARPAANVELEVAGAAAAPLGPHGGTPGLEQPL